MNKSLILSALFLFVLSGHSQDGFIQRSCQDFIYQKHITYISMSQDLLANLAKDEEEKDVSQIMSGLSELSILKSDTSDFEINNELFTRVISAVHHEGYELISQIEEQEITTQYYRKEGEKKKRTTEILMISNAPDGCLLISATGESININQLKKLSSR